MQKKQFLTIPLLFIATLTFSQKISVSEISERRSTSDDSFKNDCQIELKVSGDEVRKYKFVKISNISKIIDDQELDLLIEDKHHFEYIEIDEDAKVSIETKIPARKAKVIKELSGEINLFNPTVANGAIIKVANYLSKANTKLIPASEEIQLVYLSKESIAKYSNKQKSIQEEELNKLPETARKIAEDMLEIFKGFSNIYDEPNQVIFLIEGDSTKLTDVFFEDSKGRKIDNNGFSKTNNLIMYGFSEKLNPNWKLVLIIESANSIKKIPFKLVDIDLP